MTSIKRIPKEKVAILHSCTEKETLNRLSALLVGNGHPEDGYVYKVIEMGKQMKDINDKLSGISTVVNDLYKESIEKKAVREDHKINWVKVIQVLGVVIALGMLIIALAKVNEKADKVLTGQENLGMPFPITRSRGEPALFSDSLFLKYWPKDSSYVFIIKKVAK